MWRRLVLIALVQPTLWALHVVLPFSGRKATLTSKVSLFAHLGGERDTWEAQREEARAALERMDALEQSIRQGESPLDSLSAEIQRVEQDVTRLTSELLPPSGLSLPEYQAAMRFYLRIPLSMRVALCQALEIPDAAEDWNRTPEVVARLYEERFSLTPQRLQDALNDVDSRWKYIGKFKSYSSEPLTVEEEAEKIVSELLEGKTVEELTRENYVKQHLGRVTRKEGKSATEKDLKVLMSVLDSSTFIPNGKPETIPGGYIVRGRNTKPTGSELVAALDAKLPSEWSAQVSLLADFTGDGTADTAKDPILVLLNNDFAPTTSRWILSLSTAAAFATTFLFAVGCYGLNDAVAQHLQDLTAVGDLSGVSWFNNLLAQILLPLGGIQLLHELGHLLVAWRDKIKTSPPTLLPFWVLPFLGAQTQLKTSPKTVTSLFDFAFMGPFIGLFTSVILLVLGLQETLLADADAIQYFPALPVSVLQLSTLGGTIVDTAFGGNGIVTTQNPDTTIALHPFAIAGFSGLMINALEMLPLGSTDGGRLSQALFGRPAHVVVGGATWFALLCTTILLEPHDILLGAWVINNIAQNDMEVPCRNEVDKVNLPRSLAAFALWFVAILTLTPVSTLSL